MNAERALLSQILQDNQIYYDTQPKSWWFTDPMSRRIFTAIEEALEQGSADVVSVGMQGNASEVSELGDYAPTTKNAKFYAEQCKSTGQTYELSKLSGIITDSVKRDKPDATISLIDDVIERVFLEGTEYKIQKISDRLPQFVDAVEERYKRKGEIPGLQCGLYNLDTLLAGFQKERLYIIGARPSQGKSALMLNMASHIAIHETVGVFSLESSIDEVLMREVSLLTGLNSQSLASGSLSANDFGRIVSAGDKITTGKMYVYDKPNLQLSELVGQCRRMVRKIGAKILFVDYMQLIQVYGMQTDRERVAKASVRLKDLSRELKVPIVVLAQLRRDSDGRRPSLGDFQHTSQIEQDADVAMLIHHAVYDESGTQLHKAKPEGHETTRIRLHVDKNRDGATSSIELNFEPEFLRFTEKVDRY